MNIHGIIIKDEENDKFFAYVKQFPAICAQAESIEAVTEKISTYFKAYMERVANQEIEMTEDIVTM